MTNARPIRFEVDFTFPVKTTSFTPEDVVVEDTAPNGTKRTVITMNGLGVSITPTGSNSYYYGSYRFDVTLPGAS